MHRNKKIHSFILSFVVGAVVAASAAAQTQGSKVGIVNIQDAIVNTNEGKKEFDTLQQKFGPKNNELKAQNDEVEKLKTELQAISNKLSDEERSAKAKIISEKQKVLQRGYEDFQTLVQQAEQEVTNRLGQKMLNVLEKYANANGYSVILDVSNPQTPVLWASQNSNLTKQLVDAYNAESLVVPRKP